MTAVQPRDTPVTYFLDNRALGGCHGTLLARAGGEGGDRLAPVAGLAYRLLAPRVHHEFLANFYRSGSRVKFAVHHHLRIALSVTAVIRELRREGEGVVALVEFTVP